MPLENAYYMKKFAAAFGSTNVSYSPDPEREKRDRLAASLLKPELARSLKEIEDSDYIICAGVDPINEAPMLALMMRQAVRSGASVIIIDPRPVSLPFEFTHMPVAPDGLADALTGAVDGIKGNKPTIIIGTCIGSEELIEKAAALTMSERSEGKDCGLFYVMDGPNSFGTAMLAGDGPDFDDLLDGIEKERIKVLVVAESDPLGQYPDRDRAAKAFEKLDTLIVMDYLPSDTVNHADVFLPATAYAEQEGTFVNQEGRAQVFEQAYISGVPINDMGPDAHPPRTFSTDVPGRSLPVWQILKELACIMKPECFLTASSAAIRSEMADEFPAFELLRGLLPGDGIRLSPGAAYSPPVRPDIFETGETALTLIATELTFGTEELSTYSDMTQLRAPAPYVLLNDQEAVNLGLEPGSMVTLSGGGTTLECTLRVSGKSARGVAIVPKVKGFPVSGLAGKKITIRART
jgi:NADH-quinone oxidoreductase subunit G